MPCLIGCLALSLPRLVLLGLWLFTSYINRAFEHNIWFLLGFVFMPMTTLAYVWARISNGTVDGIYLAAVIFGVLLDLGIVTFGRGRRRRQGGGPGGMGGGGMGGGGMGGGGGGGSGPSQGPREITITGQRVG